MEESQNIPPEPKKSTNSTLIVGIVVVVLIIGGGFLLLSRGASSPTTPPQTTITTSAEPTAKAADTVSIETKSFAFSPAIIKIKAGGTITFTNRDSVAHSFTADDGKSFDSGLVGKDQTKTVTAPKPGEYPFHCTPHPYMKGTLIVE